MHESTATKRSLKKRIKELNKIGVIKEEKDAFYVYVNIKKALRNRYKNSCLDLNYGLAQSVESVINKKLIYVIECIEFDKAFSIDADSSIVIKNCKFRESLQIKNAKDVTIISNEYVPSVSSSRDNFSFLDSKEKNKSIFVLDVNCVGNLKYYYKAEVVKGPMYINLNAEQVEFITSKSKATKIRIIAKQVSFLEKSLFVDEIYINTNDLNTNITKIEANKVIIHAYKYALTDFSIDASTFILNGEEQIKSKDNGLVSSNEVECPTLEQNEQLLEQCQSNNVSFQPRLKLKVKRPPRSRSNKTKI